MTDTRTHTHTGRAVLTCKTCKHTGTRTFTITHTTTAYLGMMDTRTTITIDGRERTIRYTNDTERALHTRCPACGSTSIRTAIVQGALRESKPCDARCLNARHASCECSCAGTNHGAGHNGW
ncbi:hypothetical protein [Streptomyces antibioticus]|uniref:hypothetical protein n=1 Tax=Streptomyces antibioticus TaxID=1890 RepID=UPI0033F608D3